MSEFIAEYMLEGCQYAVLGVFTGQKPAEKAINRLKTFATRRVVATRVIEHVSKKDWPSEVDSD